MGRCHTDCIQRPLSLGFRQLGKLVGRYPWWFLIIPFVLSAGLGAGFYFLHERKANDIEDQFTPIGGPAKTKREFVMKRFPTNDSGQFSAQRLYTEGSFVSLIAVSTSDNVINVNTFNELVQLDEMVQNFTVIGLAANATLAFQQICAEVQGQKCITANPLLSAVQGNVSLIETIPISYPMFQNRAFIGTYLGGVTLNSDSTVKEAKAIKLVYYLREDSQHDKENSLQWINHLIKFFAKNALQLNHIKVSYFTSVSRQQEFDGTTKTIIPLFSITYFVTIFFSIMSCVRFDSVRNKTWVAGFGVISSGLAVLSSFGLMLLCGVPFVITVAKAPFLILGVGVDDMFIMISSWQQTKVKDKVEERMAETYSEAAVSITITTLTDVLAFYIGILTSFRSVQSFCIYTGTAILFCFLYNVTCFGAFLALNGRREENNRHWFICKKLTKEKDDNHSLAYNMCCVGGGYSQITGKEIDHPMTGFFHKYYGPFLTNTWTKVLVGFLYAGYLFSSIYGCFQVQEGIDLRNLATDSSYVRSFYDNDDLYFSEYGPRVMVVVTEEVSYWDSDVQSKIDRCLESFINNCYVSESFSESWLNAYRGMANQMNLNISDKSNFIYNLSTLFSRFPDFKQDVDIQSGAIRASRFFIQTVNVTSAVDERDMLNQVRDTAKSCEIPLLVYHPAFIYCDQYAVIIENTIQNVAVAAGAMLVISLLLIPNPMCSLWVTFTLASIIVGVTGFMAYWDVNLDSISMINLVICIGFSVDFSAHITYAYVSNHKAKVNERVIDALHSLGYPIVQGAVATILGVIALSAAESYIFRTFSKIIFLVIAFGMIHGLVFLPVFLTLFGNCMTHDKSTKIKADNQSSDNNLGETYFGCYDNIATTFQKISLYLDPDCP
ncbi:patched domain-containing protein 3 isoform X1 [Bufo gargarizans]|uniref:patched domain-containing protein 3 isoform X1 n=1 Tax=Bufo gargarizans TaxID=30331 RepID=UPI001CF4BFA9|nr:patched domain-containing protein 3 isoform X1 [Bufo gargarizans]